MIEENWESLIKPHKTSTKKPTASSAVFVIEPWERGFGLTIGNALRRVLMSSLQGAAVVGMRVDGVLHEFSVIPGVREDVTEIGLNLKQLVLRMSTPDRRKLFLKKKGPALVTAGDIQIPGGVEVINPELPICYVNEGSTVCLEIIVCVGRGYTPADMNRDPDAPIDFIPIDSLFSPVRRVAYHVENAREGKVLDYDRLIMEVDTDGTVTPEDALAFAARILQDQLSVFINFKEPEHVISEKDQIGKGINLALLKRVDELELSVRSANCLRNDSIVFLGDLVKRSEAEMLRTPNFGRKSLNEIQEVLKRYNLKLGMVDIDWPPENMEELLKKQSHHYH